MVYEIRINPPSEITTIRRYMFNSQCLPAFSYLEIVL